MHRHKRIAERAWWSLASVALGLSGTAPAQTTVSPTDRYLHGANIGWIDARPSQAAGARVMENICAGYLYSANVGWIHLGNGAPPSGEQYGQTGPGDYGVNVHVAGIYAPIAGLGRLSGYAYGANIGWIHFAPQGDPQINLVTGKLSGHAWGANVGWISLGEFTLSVATMIAPGTDTDGDGMANFWETNFFGDQDVAGPATDYDGDGTSDLAEHQADTDPTNPEDRLRLVSFTIHRAPPRPNLVEVRLTTKPTRFYRLEYTTNPAQPAPWTDSGLGAFPADDETTDRSFTTPAGPRVFFRAVTVRPLAP